MKGRAVGRTMCRWEDNIKMDLGEIQCEDVDSTRLAQDRVQLLPVMNMVMNSQVPYKAENFFMFLHCSRP
jgi:hypothetical protein